MRRMSLVPLVLALVSGALMAQGAGKKVLFDHTHHEEAGTSAFWVICSGSEPNPSPANPTKETDWNGGISALAFDLYKQGYTVQTLPASGGKITYGDSTNAYDLSKYNVFFIPECYTYFTTAEKQAIVKFVQNGGGLFLEGNHDGAARYSGGTDAFHVFNDLISNNGIINNGFGFTFVDGYASGTNANVTSTAFSTSTTANMNAIVRGPNGTLTMQDFHSFSFLTVNTSQNSTAQGILASQISGATGKYHSALCEIGSGRVVAIGDSSPADDGTCTTSGKSLYVSYSINSNRPFFLNAIQWLAGSAANQAPTVAITTPSSSSVTATTNTAVSFAATATDPEGGSLTTTWSFGDGTTATGTSASHAWTTAGTYTVTFTAKDAQGASSSATRTVTVSAPAGNTVTANLTTPTGNLTVATGTAVAFAGSGTDSSSTAVLSYAWAFGDGGTATGTSATHTYTNTGTAAVAYTARFTVTDETGASGSATRQITVNPATTTGSSLSETFDTGTKTAYTSGSVTFASGSWTLNDALLGNTSSDPKEGAQSVRTRNSGTLTMNFNFATGAQTVSVKHAKYGTDANSTWSMWYSTNGGSTWTQAGSAVTTSSTTLSTATFTVGVSGAIRFQIRKTDGSSSRVNFDSFSITGY